MFISKVSIAFLTIDFLFIDFLNKFFGVFLIIKLNKTEAFTFIFIIFHKDNFFIIYSLMINKII